MKRSFLTAAAAIISLAAFAQGPQGGQQPPQGNIPGMGPRFVQTPDPEYVAYSEHFGK